jgi:hypothetical protein
MIKKTAKLMVAALLATGFGMSVFIEAAQAQTLDLDTDTDVPEQLHRRIANEYSQTDEQQQYLKARFSLVNTTRDGIPIDDALGGTDDIGLFRGAIENYAPAQGLICLSSSIPYLEPYCAPGSSNYTFNKSPRYRYDSSGFPIFVSYSPLQTTGTPFDGDLLAQFVEPGRELMSGQSPFQGLEKPAAIAYSIFRTNSILGADEPVFSYRLLNLAGLDITKAVNSLDYILENNLLGAAQPVLSRDTDSAGNPRVNLGIGNALIQDRSETVVPEPDTAMSSLLAFGVLGAGSLLKRKMKQS